MARPSLLQSDYSRGSVSDLSRHLLPKSSVWRMIDYLPNHDGAPLAKRGGWLDASPALGSSARTMAVAYAPFSAGSQLVGFTEDGHLWKITNPTTAADIGAAALPLQRPVFFNNALIIPASTPKTYNGTAVSNLGGTPPGGIYGATYKGRLILGGSAANPNRIWFSDILNAALWNTTDGYIDLTNPLRGIAPLRNAILCWSDGATERIRGDIAPPGGDMILEPLFEEGCVDARSIVVYGDRAIWANSNGVHLSDGAAIANLIELGGQQQFWAELFAGYTSTWTVAAGVVRGFYVICIMDGDTFKMAAMCDLESKTWLFLDNVKATMFAEAYGAQPELYFSMRGRPRVGRYSPIFLPTSTNVSDADGTAVEPELETAYFRGAPGSRRWKTLRIGNQISSADTSTHLEVAYVRSPEDTSYVTLADTIPVTGKYERTKMPIRLANDGFALRIRQVGASTETQLFDIEVDMLEREESR